MEDKEIFEKHWEKFITRLKGKMIKQSEKQKLTYPMVKLLLSDTVLDWGSEYDEIGRWLMDYSKRNPEQGGRIRNVLMDDMNFTEIAQQKDYSEVINYAVPLAGAIAGFGVSSLWHAGTVVKAVSTLAPAAILYPSTKALGTAFKDNSRNAMINGYMEQLGKYKMNVLSILEG